MESLKRKKILFVTPVFGEVRNGPALYANVLCEGFCNDPDIEFHLLIPEGSLSSIQQAEQQKRGSDRRIHTFKTFSKSLPYYRSMQRSAIDLLKQQSFSEAIVHGNIAHAMAPVLREAATSIVQVNDYEAARGFTGFFGNRSLKGTRNALSLAWRHRQESLSLQCVDHLVVNSNYLSGVLEQYYRIPDRVARHTIYKGVNVEHFSTPRPPSSLIPPGTGRNLVFVGADWLRKGLDLAIEALNLLPEPFADCRLFVAGETTVGKNEILRLVDELNLQRRVIFLGSVSRDDLPGLLQSSDASLLLSRYEAFGVAVLESLAAGLPVVGSRRGGIPEILEGATHSFLVEPDVDAITQGICKALTQNREQARCEGLRIASKFSTTRMVERVKSLYMSIS